MCDVTATLDTPDGATGVTSGAWLRLDVIKPLAAAKLDIPVQEVTDIVLAELFGTTRETIWRFRNRKMTPSLATAIHMAKVLATSVEEIAVLTPGRVR